MSQDTFNKIVTVALTLFFMTMYVISFITGKTVDWTTILTFAVPTLNHVVHQITQTQVTNKNTDSFTARTVAQIGAVNGKSQSPTPTA